MTRKPAAAGNQERRAYHREPQSALAADAVPPGTKVLAYTTFPAPYRVELFEVLASRFQVRAVYERSTD